MNELAGREGSPSTEVDQNPLPPHRRPAPGEPGPSPRDLRNRTVLLGTIAGALLVAVWMAILLSWYPRAPPGTVTTGLFQGDMPTYLCNGRMASASPTVFSYASPHDFREPPRPVFVSLPITIIGWLLGLLRSPALVENGLRLVGGIACYAALAALLARLFGGGRWFWAAWALTGLGGGLSWVAAIALAPEGMDWWNAVAQVESDVYWWGLTLVRNLMYPLELAYHALLFGMIVFLSDRRWRAAIGLFAVGVLCSPFVGIQMAGVLLPTLFLVRGPSRWQRFALLAISAAFAVYYLLVLSLDPVGASIQSQHQLAYPEPLSIRNLVLGHGLAVLGAFSLADGSFRRWLWREPFGPPLVALAGSTFFLTQSSRVPGFPHLQPHHFTRGYLAVALWCLLLLWIRHLLADRPRVARAAPAALFALVVSALPDSVLFARDQWSNPPAFPLLTVPAAQLDALAFLAKDPVPRRVLTFDLDLTRQVCAFTRHRPLFGTMFTTPDALGRWKQALRFRAEADRATSVGSVPIDVVLAPRADSDLMRGLIANRAFRVAFANEAFVIFRREL